MAERRIERKWQRGEKKENGREENRKEMAERRKERKWQRGE